MRVRKRSVGVLGVACTAVVATVVATAGGAGAAPASGTGAAAREPLDLLYISDSSGSGVARLYGREINETLGVRVRVYDEWQPDLSAVQILRSLRSAIESWSGLVRRAEVIVVYGSPAGLTAANGGTCFYGKPLVEVGPHVWVNYVAGLKAIYRRIFAIRKGKPVILRTANWYVAAPKRWDEAGMLEICTKEWESFSVAITKAAAAYRVPVADVYTAFNGMTHLEDPVEKGYIQPDGIRPSDTGRAVIAKTLADLGYRKVGPPR